MISNINNIDTINNIIKSNEVILLKFDNKISKYDEFIHTLNLKVINITDKDIIDFYEIDILPTIIIYKNNNLINTIVGFHTKTSFIKKILDIIDN
jgi:hypothetical protein